MAEDKKICKIVRPRGDTLDVLTRMPEKELVAELEYEFKGEEGSRDPIWARFEGINSHDERVPVAMLREDIRAYLIIPFHPSEMAAQRQAAPRLIQ